MANKMFKVGDKVRVKKGLIVGEVYGNYSFVDKMKDYEDRILTIESLDTYGYYFKKSEFVWTDEMLEPAGFDKDLLRDGVVVECRDGELGLVLGDRVLKRTQFRLIRDYTDDLKANDYDTDRDTDRDIVKVYRLNKPCDLRDLFDRTCLELIAERKEVRKMTVSEISKELGYEVEIIKEDK